MKTLNLNFKQLFMLLFVSIIVCISNLFYSKNQVAYFNKNEFVEREDLEDSIIISNAENNSVFAGYKNIINYSPINSKNLKIEAENCTIELLKLGKLVLFASLSQENTCKLIFKDSVKNIILDKLQFNIYPLPDVGLFLGGVENGGDIDNVNSFELNFSYPDYILSTSEFKILSFELLLLGKTISATGNLKDCKDCIDLINTLEKGKRFSILLKYTTGSNISQLCGVWQKNY